MSEFYPVTRKEILVKINAFNKIHPEHAITEINSLNDDELEIKYKEKCQLVQNAAAE